MKKDQLVALKAGVFSNLPVLERIYARHGEQSVADYVAAWQLSRFSPEDGLAELLEQSLSQVYGSSLAKSAAGQFAASRLVSTIDHHGLVGHPFFLSSNLIFGQRPELSHLLVFSTSGVSLNNSSWPGCLVLTHPRTGELVRLSFFQDGHKTRTVFKAAPISRQSLSRVGSRLGCMDFIGEQDRQRLAKDLERIFSSPEFLGLSSFSLQACLASQQLWQLYLPGFLPLVYYPIEDLAARILVQKICADDRHPLYWLFFTAEGWESLDRYFRGVRGAHGNGRGSFLFWGQAESGARTALVKSGGFLEGGGCKILLSAQSLSEELSARRIYPNSLTCFITMLFYGVTCVGGFNQTTWLSEIKQRLAALFLEAGESRAAQQVEGAVTDNFAESGLAFVRSQKGLRKASGLDLYLQGGWRADFAALSRAMTLSQSIEAELPEIYRIAVPEKQRVSSLASASLGEIAGLNGLDSLLEDRA